jgi:hypothetical protein
MADPKNKHFVINFLNDITMASPKFPLKDAILQGGVGLDAIGCAVAGTVR